MKALVRSFGTNKRFATLVGEGVMPAVALAADPVHLAVAYEDEAGTDTAKEYLLVLVAVGYAWECAERRLDAATAKEMLAEIEAIDHESIFDAADRAVERLPVLLEIVVTKARRIGRGFYPDAPSLDERVEARAVIIGTKIAQELARRVAEGPREVQ